MLERKLQELTNAKDIQVAVDQMESTVNTTIDFFTHPIDDRINKAATKLQQIWRRMKDNETQKLRDQEWEYRIFFDKLSKLEENLSNLKIELIQVYKQAKKNNNSTITDYIENYMHHLNHLKETIEHTPENDEELLSAVNNVVNAANRVSRTLTAHEHKMGVIVGILGTITGAILGAICFGVVAAFVGALGGFLCWAPIEMGIIGGCIGLLGGFFIGAYIGYQEGYSLVEKDIAPEIDIEQITATLFKTENNIHLFFPKNKFLHKEDKPPITEKSPDNHRELVRSQAQPLLKAGMA